jgi:hypothetical protein
MVCPRQKYHAERERLSIPLPFVTIVGAFNVRLQRVLSAGRCRGVDRTIGSKRIAGFIFAVIIGDASRLLK